MTDQITITPFHPLDADHDTVAQLYDLRVAARAIDMPEGPVPTLDAMVAALRREPADGGTQRYLHARLDGRLAGAATIELPTGGNEAIAKVAVEIHPALRRRGIGTRLLAAALTAVEQSGREIVSGVFVHADAPADSWGRSLGFRTVHQTIVQTLPIESTRRELWDVAVPAGYRLVRWTGHTPEDLLASYASVRDAVQDAPTGRSTIRPIRWTAASIRETERLRREQGIEERVTIAIHEDTGQIAANHLVVVYPGDAPAAQVYETAVVAAHRGHGLGRAIKADMMRVLLSEQPKVMTVVTSTAATNTHMIAVNEALGYRTLRTVFWIETTTKDLAARLRPADG